jgi:hypothetical protein
VPPPRLTDPHLQLELDVYYAQLQFRGGNLAALRKLSRELRVKINVFEQWTSRTECPVPFQTARHMRGTELVTDDEWWTERRASFQADIGALRQLAREYQARIAEIVQRQDS